LQTAVDSEFKLVLDKKNIGAGGPLPPIGLSSGRISHRIKRINPVSHVYMAMLACQRVQGSWMNSRQMPFLTPAPTHMRISGKRIRVR